MEFNDGVQNSFETENTAQRIVLKRPRGRPKIVMASGDTSRNACGDTNYLEKSLNKVEHSKKKLKYDGREINVKKRSRGRPKLSKSPTAPTEHPETLSDQGNRSNDKRGRGRPPGSLNRKHRHSLNEKSQSLNATPNESSSNEQTLTTNAKRGRGRPPGARNKPKTIKLQPKSVKLQPKSSIYLSRHTQSILKKRNALKKSVTKQKYQPVDVRDIPKHRFDEAITMLTNPEHPIWEERNTSCNKSIHRHWDEYATVPSDHNLRLKFARQFLIRRDWVNLCKVLSISLQDVVTHCNSYYSLFTKYASICLAHTDKQQFNKFLQFLLKTEDGEKVLKKCTQFSQNCTDEEEV